MDHNYVNRESQKENNNNNNRGTQREKFEEHISELSVLSAQSFCKSKYATPKSS
jgi:hypothetical protein